MVTTLKNKNSKVNVFRSTSCRLSGSWRKRRQILYTWSHKIMVHRCAASCAQLFNWIIIITLEPSNSTFSLCLQLFVYRLKIYRMCFNYWFAQTPLLFSFIIFIFCFLIIILDKKKKRRISKQSYSEVNSIEVNSFHQRIWNWGGFIFIYY